MEFVEIQHLGQVFPGEYLYHQPTQEMVLCGRLDFDKKTIKARRNNGMFVAPMAEFRKINLSPADVRAQKATRCKGCGSR